jgi:hypothetical protein
MTKQLTILLDGKKVLDIPVTDAVLEMNNPWQEVRSNQRLAAAAAGAPPEILTELPGEQVAYMHSGTEIILTYKFYATAENAGITEFRPAVL